MELLFYSPELDDFMFIQFVASHGDQAYANIRINENLHELINVHGTCDSSDWVWIGIV